MRKCLFFCYFLLMLTLANAQPSGTYVDSLQDFRNHYIEGHEVVQKAEKLLRTE